MTVYDSPQISFDKKIGLYRLAVLPAFFMLFFYLRKTIPLLFLIVLTITDLYAQNTLFQKKSVEEIIRHHSFVNSPAWREWHEMKRMRNNFPAMASYYQQRMDEIEAQYNILTNQQISPSNPNHANTIIQRTNQHMRSNAPATQEDIIANVERQKQEQKLKYLADLLNDISRNQPHYTPDFMQSADFLKESVPFWSAFNKLRDMLEGKIPFSLKDAFFIYETAYGQRYLSYEEYTSILKESVAFIRQWAKENHRNLNLPEDAHYCIQKFMRDTLSVRQPMMKTHFPFFYDYSDPRGTQDIRSQHVNKTLATGTGQCHTLPVTYSLLAEGIGVSCYISYAPHHSFIKYPDNKGFLLNYEPTSHWHLSDQYYEDWLHIKSEAKISGIYLDTLNPKMIVAACIMDLAFGYENRIGVADGKFMTECIDYAMQYFPKEANIQGHLLRGLIITTKLERLMRKQGISDIHRMDEVPGALELYNQLGETTLKIESLGHQDIPEEVYEKLVKEHEQKGRIQAVKNIDTKVKRNQFVTQ